MPALLILISCSNQTDNYVYPESNKVPFSEEVHGYVIIIYILIIFDGWYKYHVYIKYIKQKI